MPTLTPELHGDWFCLTDVVVPVNEIIGFCTGSDVIGRPYVSILCTRGEKSPITFATALLRDDVAVDMEALMTVIKRSNDKLLYRNANLVVLPDYIVGVQNEAIILRDGKPVYCNNISHQELLRSLRLTHSDTLLEQQLTANWIELSPVFSVCENALDGYVFRVSGKYLWLWINGMQFDLSYHPYPNLAASEEEHRNNAITEKNIYSAFQAYGNAALSCSTPDGHWAVKCALVKGILRNYILVESHRPYWIDTRDTPENVAASFWATQKSSKTPLSR